MDSVARLSRFRSARLTLLALLLATQVVLSLVSFPTKASDGVTLAGTLYEPQGRTTRLPGVVVMHACDGLDPDIAAWGNWFAQNGYVALAYMRTLPDVDPAHIAIVGFSHGGGAVLWTENAQVASEAGFAQNGFAAAVAFYPSACEQRPVKSLLDPLLLLIGASDNWTDAKACQDFMGALDQSGAAGTIHVYPNTYHKFDDPSANKQVHIRGNVYTLQYNSKAAADAYDRVLAFFKQYL